MLRQSIESGKTVWAAGAYDALSARLIQEAGFESVFTTGFGISASLLGRPDAELYTMTENLGVVRNVAATCTVPLVADCDTGYGNAINVMRTVREFENAGAAGLILEDQVSPKRCPAVSDMIDLLPVEEAAAKIRAAVATRRDPDLVIIARTDALEEAECVHRARAYVAAGADLVQPISKCFSDIAGLRRLREAVGVPLSLPMLGWLERELDPAEVESVAGWAVFAFVPLFTATAALRTNLERLCASKSARALPAPRVEQAEFKRLIGFEELERLQREFMPSPENARA
jgi:methylisocitrate lyase